MTRKNQPPPGSKTALAKAVKALDAEQVLRGLAAHPELADYRDDRNRNWLHLCCGINAAERGLPPAAAVELATGLLELGFDVNEPAFTEGDWQATPLWYAVARGRNIELAACLLEAGSTAEHCLWAAAFNEDLPLLRLLIEAGASLDAIAEDETPMLGAIKYSKFKAARLLLDAGSDPDFIDGRGMTALHYMLKKGSDASHFKMFVDHGARGDIPGPDGRTAAQILAKKRGAEFSDIATRLPAALT